MRNPCKNCGLVPREDVPQGLCLCCLGTLIIAQEIVIPDEDDEMASMDTGLAPSNDAATNGRIPE